MSHDSNVVNVQRHVAMTFTHLKITKIQPETIKFEFDLRVSLRGLKVEAL